MPAIIVQTSNDSSYYANVTPRPNGDIFVQVCRRILWARQMPGKPGPAANRPPTPMQRLIHATTYDSPLHVVLDGVHNVLLELERGK